MVIIDAKDLIVGRLSSFVAKKALLGENVIVVNAEKAIISGSKENIINKYLRKVRMGNPFKGPFWPRRADLLLRRIIRGMLPWKKPRGREAYKRIKCFIGMPEQFKNEEIITIEEANKNKLRTFKYMRLEELCKLLKG